jgi:hypothetical protein
MYGFEHRPGKAERGGGRGVGEDSARALCGEETAGKVQLGAIGEEPADSESQRGEYNFRLLWNEDDGPLVRS